MTIKEIIEALDGNIRCGESHLNDEITKAFSSDLMSDVLTLKDCPLLLTGLCNVQTIRTCEMANLQVIVFVRHKKVTPEMIELAEENDMVLIECEYSMFKTSGILYMKGLEPLY